ncbi:MAG: ABC transporter substrate-binding protein [Lachnospiraceae bacterium]|nr:ABC transporter substrate-binding protein [Lachnospiraceae bacterium]
MLFLNYKKTLKNKNYRKLIALFFIAVFCMCSLCACSLGGSKASKKNYITIGRICPLTGEYSEYAEGTLETERAAVEALNESGGIYVDTLDKKLMVRYLLEDSGSTKLGAEAAANKLINEEHADVIIVSDTNATVNAVSGVCEKAKVPCFCVNAEMDSWLAQGPYKYCFNISYDTEGQLVAAEEVIKENGVSNLGLITDSFEEGKAFAEKAQKFCTDEKIKVVAFSFGEEIVKQLKTGNVDGILCYLGTDDYISLKADINRAEIGLKASILVNEHWPYTELSANSQSASFDETYIPVCWAPVYEYESSLTKQSGADLEDWWKKEYVSPCPETVGYRHGIIEVVVDVLRRAMAVDSESVVNAAHDISLDTVLGPIAYSRNNSVVLSCTPAQWHYEGSSALGENKWVETVTVKKNSKKVEESETEKETTVEEKTDSDSKDK